MIAVFAVRSVGLLVFIVGAQLTFHRTRPNLWSGLRLPWTLADSEVWEKANRVAGYLTALYSVLFFLPVEAATALALALPGAGVCGGLAALYARRIYRIKYGTTRTIRLGFGRYEPSRKG